MDHTEEGMTACVSSLPDLSEVNWGQGVGREKSHSREITHNDDS